ncbi:MAG: flap endonuclease-1 [Thermoprotei archaeon]|nr:MAG: flap endonuclease-1 [Thermoprotei archaeon]RLF24179.1 MAG: flap endonuclease-1 [Thermoprotei archaeon]
MGVNLRELVPRREITFEELRGRVIAIDAYNALYQFLATIRQPDGTPLMDSRGNITSHLSGLLYRTVNLLEMGIKPVYVFDGKPPEMKDLEILKRMKHKEEALRKYEEALRRGDIRSARKYAQQTGRLTEEMVKDAKRLLDLLGVPWVQAPSEGEAQAAYMTIKGDAWATASQDYDSLLFGAVRLVRNLTISGRRKLPGKDIYVEISPELIELDKVLKELGINRRQLVDVAILIGTDYNPEGVKGIGPKKALRLIKTYGSLEKVLPIIKEAQFPVDPLKIREFFLNPDVTDRYSLEWRTPDVEGLVKFLCGEHDFSESRVKRAAERALKAIRELRSQTSLEAWF